MKPVEIRERPFVLEALVFLERVRMLSQKGLEATGGPMGETGEIFDLLDAESGDTYLIPLIPGKPHSIRQSC